MLSIVVLISGNGSNLQAIIDSLNNQSVLSPKSNTESAKITAIISNRSKAYGLERARQHKIPAYVIPKRKNQTREAYDQRLSQVLNELKPDLIVLAGFMRIFSKEFVNEFQGKIINIHPSLLPKYRGLDTHQRAIEAGDKEHGCSVHFVTPELDGGPIIAQAKTKISNSDDTNSLSAKVQLLEHKIYPLVISWLAQNRLQLLGEQVILDGTVLNKPYLMTD